MWALIKAENKALMSARVLALVDSLHSGLRSRTMKSARRPGGQFDEVDQDLLKLFGQRW